MIPKQLQGPNFRFIKVGDNKAPIEKNWTSTTNYQYNDSEFSEWVNTNKRYGVACGFGDLIVIDFDNKDIQDKLFNELPQTFTVKTAGKGLNHLYYIIKGTKKASNNKGFRVKDINKDTLCDVQGQGTQVIGPNSTLANGKSYEIVRDIPITKIYMTDIEKLFKPWTKAEKQIEKSSEGLTGLRAEIAKKVTIRQLLNNYKINTGKNPTDCPLGHDSHGGMCFSYTKELWNCFHCGKAGTAVELVKYKENISTFEAEQKLCKALDIDTSQFPRRLLLPGWGTLVSTFADNASNILKDKESIFFRPTDFNLVEIKVCKGENKLKTYKYKGFEIVTPHRFVNILERYSETLEYNVHDETTIEKSLPPNAAKTVMANDVWTERLPYIERIFTFPIPLMRDNKILFPKHKYDKRFHSWLIEDAPKMSILPIEDAKNIINEIYKEFCFKGEQDRVNAMANLLTEFCQGLYPKFNTRTPIFIWEANRERSGKDCGGLIPGIVFEGFGVEGPPVCVQGGTNQADELRKKITTMLKNGRRRYHSSNNRGFISNEVLENISTSEYWSDRILGSNTEVRMPNELFLSLSVNLGYTTTPDLVNRSRYVRLFLDIENANERKFNRVDLHGWVLKNRGPILSALYTFVNNWCENGMPPGKTPFTSFPDWARVVGGIMVCNGLGDPCTKDEDEDFQPDKQTADIKLLFKLLYEEKPNTELTTSDMIRMITEGGYQVFEHLNMISDTDNSAKIKFGKMIKKYIGRIFGDIKMVKCGEKIRSNKQKFRFELQQQGDE